MLNKHDAKNPRCRNFQFQLLPKELFSTLCPAPNLKHVAMRSTGPDPYVRPCQSNEHPSRPFYTIGANLLENIFYAERIATKL
jgi:hypothetical protein